MRSTVYLETTIVSYLTARPSRDVILHAHQQLTQEWWYEQRELFEVYISPIVMVEAQRGDAEQAQRRMEALAGIPQLSPTQDALDLAKTLVAQGPIPEKAELDALHIAITAVHGIQYLLTWNCKHIANARMRHQIESLCREGGYEPPVLCTPEELGDEE